MFSILKASRSIGQRIVGIVDGHRPTFHVRMKPALHIKRPAALVQIYRSDQRFARRMIVDGMDIAAVMLMIHHQRCIE